VGLCVPCQRWWGWLCRRRCAAGGCARAVLVWGGVSRGYTIIINSVRFGWLPPCSLAESASAVAAAGSSRSTRRASLRRSSNLASTSPCRSPPERPASDTYKGAKWGSHRAVCLHTHTYIHILRRSSNLARTRPCRSPPERPASNT